MTRQSGLLAGRGTVLSHAVDHSRGRPGWRDRVGSGRKSSHPPRERRPGTTSASCLDALCDESHDLPSQVLPTASSGSPFGWSSRWSSRRTRQKGRAMWASARQCPNVRRRR